MLSSGFIAQALASDPKIVTFSILCNGIRYAKAKKLERLVHSIKNAQRLSIWDLKKKLKTKDIGLLHLTSGFRLY